ncbi:formate dehydrogenase accessory sulfurtransferase FdhD [Crenobacter sp. SG2303]|uniref:Sulfur carrier protein FdhD n=1 Tax=Crenobacter oryzisoli TaxID=3056844 RepID=A0ABT7XU36_9NEIS|nr:formate dehydrogenase accessory sulfurtransferase FdhD [Crenobacter sp. SG2303]MDN0077245.1 formate dehydrogenase accessory sulfurtransferase FdhD [Crenobacter sp. SG2303]
MSSALVYNGLAHTVMMASPQQLGVFALGFTLAEGIARSASEVYGIEVVERHDGIEVRIELASRAFANLKERRRQLAGRTGCGLCGVEQLAEVHRPIAPLPFGQSLTIAALDAALTALPAAQKLSRLTTGACHAAAWVLADGTLAAVSEDVGRHVALDKLIGYRALEGWSNGAALITTSRASFEMVQKAAQVGIEILLAVSAPTQMAVKMSNDLGMTLVGFARPGRANIYTHAGRIHCD